MARKKTIVSLAWIVHHGFSASKVAMALARGAIPTALSYLDGKGSPRPLVNLSDAKEWIRKQQRGEE